MLGLVILLIVNQFMCWVRTSKSTLLPVVMQPHSPQLPTDSSSTPAAKHWKKPTLYVLLVAVVLVALVALLMPKKQVEGQSASPTTEHPATSAGYKSPASK